MSFSSKQSQAFSELHAAFTRALILAYYDAIRKIRVETDASAFALAVILLQLQDNG
jgi:hypothetical protein